MGHREGDDLRAWLANATTVASPGTRRNCQVDYLCMQGGYFWSRTSENSVNAKFAEFYFCWTLAITLHSKPRRSGVP